jgi:hypothetical protein
MPVTIDLSLFLALTCGHLLGDFVLQTERMVREKGRLRMLLAHAAVVGVATYILAGVWEAWWLVLGIVVLHALTDWVKSRTDSRSMAVFWIDQAAHFAVLLGAAWLAPRLGFGSSWWMTTFGSGPVTVVLVFTVGLVTTVWVGAVVVGLAVGPFLPVVRQTGEQPDALSPRDRGLAKGGRLIGLLERGLIFFLVFIGRPEAVAFLVAAKSVFRFGELKDPQNRVEAEYILIGTLMSFTWGLVAAWAARAALAGL